jgi:hypothetical protein
MMRRQEVPIMTSERPDEELPEHERRPETSSGSGLSGSGGTAPETSDDPRPRDVDREPDERERPTWDPADEEPEDPDGPDVAYQPKSV